MSEIRYNTNFLTGIICKIDFPSIEDYNLTKLKEFRSLIKERFPIIEESKSSLFEFSIGEEQKVKAKSPGAISWLFYNKNKNKIGSISNSGLSIEFKKYTNFEEFFEDITFLVESLFSIFPSVFSTRIGIRYVNEIKLEGEDVFNWSEYINQNLIKSIDFFTPNEKEGMTKSISRIELQKDNYYLTFQFGIPNSLYPNQIIRKEFVLDYDCFTHESFEKDGILEKIREFHQVIIDIFEKSICNRLRDEMGRS